MEKTVMAAKRMGDIELVESKGRSGYKNFKVPFEINGKRADMRFQKKLSKKELTHMRYACGGEKLTLRRFKENRKFQTEDMKMNLDKPEACWDCRIIAKKLGLEEA